MHAGHLTYQWRTRDFEEIALNADVGLVYYADHSIHKEHVGVDMQSIGFDQQDCSHTLADVSVAEGP